MNVSEVYFLRYSAQHLYVNVFECSRTASTITATAVRSIAEWQGMK